MGADIVTTLVNLGAAGAVIIVVVYFLNFIKERDRQWQEFFGQIHDTEQGVFRDLKTALEAVRDELMALRNEVRNHDKMARGAIREMSRKQKGVKG